MYTHVIRYCNPLMEAVVNETVTDEYVSRYPASNRGNRDLLLVDEAINNEYRGRWLFSDVEGLHHGTRSSTVPCYIVDGCSSVHLNHCDFSSRWFFPLFNYLVKLSSIK